MQIKCYIHCNGNSWHKYLLQEYSITGNVGEVGKLHVQGTEFREDGVTLPCPVEVTRETTEIEE